MGGQACRLANELPTYVGSDGWRSGIRGGGGESMVPRLMMAISSRQPEGAENASQQVRGCAAGTLAGCDIDRVASVPASDFTCGTLVGER